MATPLLDKEILKLRRRLGDVYDESGNEIVTNTSPPAGQIWVGNSGLISTWKRDELIDIWNSAIKTLIAWVLKSNEPLDNYAPGYVAILTSQSTTAFGSYRYRSLTSLTPSVFRVLDVRDSNVTTGLGLGVYVSPKQFFAHQIDFLSTRKDQLLYTRMAIDSSADALVLFNATGASPTVDIVYVKNHTDLVHGTGAEPDISGLTDMALQRVQVISEIVAGRYRRTGIEGLAEKEFEMFYQVGDKDGPRTQ